MLRLSNLFCPQFDFACGFSHVIFIRVTAFQRCRCPKLDTSAHIRTVCCKACSCSALQLRRELCSLLRRDFKTCFGIWAVFIPYL
eukprot:1147610-Pelagomonas_calceolata.AAC.3